MFFPLYLVILIAVDNFLNEVGEIDLFLFFGWGKEKINYHIKWNKVSLLNSKDEVVP